jgi:PKD repeat protein
MNKKYLLLMLLAICIQACKRKETPLPQTGVPVFLFSGSIGTEAVTLQAGIEHLFMYTGFLKDSQNLMTLKSYFAKDNCTGCEPYLSFELKDQSVSIGSNPVVSINSLIQPGMTFNSYSTDSIMSISQLEEFTFFPEDSIGGTFNWDFGDGTTSTLQSPKHIFSTGGLKNIRLVRQAFGSIDSMSNIINTDPGSTCRAQFTYQNDTLLNTYTFEAIPAGLPYTWNFGNGDTSIGSNVSTTYAIPGFYLVTLSLASPACNLTFRKKINESGTFKPSANFDYKTDLSVFFNMLPRLNSKAFIITWKKNGQEYRSYKNTTAVNQSASPIFKVHTIQTYSNNAAGNKTVKVSGSVDTYLYNYSNWQDSVRIKSDSLIIAFAYPN